MNAENMYDAWDNGDRHEIRQQLAKRNKKDMTDRELMQQWIRPGAIVPVDMNTVRILLDALRERLARQEQERREWLGLTEAERIDIIDEEITAQSTEHFALAQAIEAKLREKNA